MPKYEASMGQLIRVGAFFQAKKYLEIYIYIQHNNRNNKITEGLIPLVTHQKWDKEA